ncbi:hypothetical protein [Enterococcus alishanensis]|uniref:Beta-1,6-galactofuranosyltransferase n=1 Tax=Enterococcus alishanensis TaxID=1303817 RepID=A0ABS6TDY1_9ENTE|nr:hypothetical protein [Enterococcus alishanensis]MBV7391108.1 hypothetical protein [Enterococcus alishanensis]
MKKWLTHIIEGASVDAVSKSRGDIGEIGRSVGYDPLYIYRYQDPNETLDALKSRIDGITAAAKPGDLLIYQYPNYNGGLFEETFINRMKMRRMHVAILVHDSELIRGSSYNDEKKLFNMADVLIVHNQRMEDELRAFGVTTKMIHKELFDYLVPDLVGKPVNTLNKKIVFAGNVQKSLFLREWDAKTKMIVYGRKGKVELSEQIDYQGEFLQDELLRMLPNDGFGLAWDEDIPDGGFYGRYTKYNAPHKISLYLSLGMPVIVWEESAAAIMVKKYGLGYTISALDEIDDLMVSIDAQELISVKNRVIKFSKVLREGMFTKNAINQFENYILFPEPKEVIEDNEK